MFDGLVSSHPLKHSLVYQTLSGDIYPHRHLHGDGVRVRRRALRLHRQAWKGEPGTHAVTPGNPYWKGRLSTVRLLLQTSVDQVLDGLWIHRQSMPINLPCSLYVFHDKKMTRSVKGVVRMGDNILRRWSSSMWPNSRILIGKPLASKTGQKNDLNIATFGWIHRQWIQQQSMLMNPPSSFGVFPNKNGLFCQRCCWNRW